MTSGTHNNRASFQWSGQTIVVYCSHGLRASMKTSLIRADPGLRFFGYFVYKITGFLIFHHLFVIHFFSFLIHERKGYKFYEWYDPLISSQIRELINKLIQKNKTWKLRSMSVEWGKHVWHSICLLCGHLLVLCWR